jgi:hypothetical protein
MVVGSVVASFAVERFSVDGLRSLSRSQINGRYADFRNMTYFDSKPPLE